MQGLNLAPLTIVLMMATLNESIIEYLFGSIKPLRPYLPLISLATGLVLAFCYQINIMQLLLNVQSNFPVIDLTLSGFFISRGSNFVNDFARKALGSK
jgi:hypothetical protein